MRQLKLEKRARGVIINQIREFGEMTTEEIMDLIRPHFNFDYQSAKEQSIRATANQIVAQIRDECGIRTVFNCKKDGVSKYINIDASNNVEDLKDVEQRLSKKLIGLEASRTKASRRRMEVEGQLSFDFSKAI